MHPVEILGVGAKEVTVAGHRSQAEIHDNPQAVTVCRLDSGRELQLQQLFVIAPQIAVVQPRLEHINTTDRKRTTQLTFGMMASNARER